MIFSQDRTKKPCDFKGKSTFNTNPSRNKPCIFCIGYEDECTPEIFRVPFDELNWKIRVVEHPYPALSRYVPELHNVPPEDTVLDGFGIHDVVIESPVHSDQLLELSPREIGEVFVAFINRIHELVPLGSIKYIQVCLFLWVFYFFEFNSSFYILRLRIYVGVRLVCQTLTCVGILT